MRNFCEQFALDFIFAQNGNIYFLEFHNGPGAFAGSALDITTPIYQGHVLYTRSHETMFYHKTPRKKRYCLGIDHIGSNKRRIYNLFQDLQPRTYVKNVTDISFFEWLNITDCEFVVFKHPESNAGVNLEFHKREDVISRIERGEDLPSDFTPLVQEFVSPLLYAKEESDVADRYGAVRIVLTLRCIDNKYDILYSYPYLRLASKPWNYAPDRGAMIANISNNGSYKEMTPDERKQIYEASWRIPFRIMKAVTKSNFIKIEKPKMLRYTEDRLRDEGYI